MKVNKIAVVVNVWPREGNVLNLLGFFQYLELAKLPSIKRYDWGIDARFQYSGIEFRIIDHMPDKDAEWGGPSDNMFSLSLERKTAEEAVKEVENFWKARDYVVETERVSDGSYDVMIPELFVSFKFNILSYY
jgi:hypothetical protein